MENVQSNRELICVKFPGIVKNDERAIQCLGGIREISQVYSESSKRRLGLSFQPENPYMKKLYGDACKSAGLLLRVRVKKTKVNNEVKREVLSTSVVGRVKLMYQFNSMCDFQMIPVQNRGESSRECMIENLLPSGLEPLSFLHEPALPFILPPNFTRSDKPMPYLYTFKKYPERKAALEADDLHQKLRGDRGLPGRLFVFNLVDELATEPHQFYIKQKEERQRVYPLLEKESALVAKFFQDRPICTNNLLRYETKLRMQSLKVILPCLAIQMKDGPWKMCWVRYGYDPRKDPASRIYQVVDFRLRTTTSLHTLVQTRDKTIHKLKKTDRVRGTKRRLNLDESATEEVVPEGAVYFRPGMVPSQRQIYYQYCDIDLPEVQELMAVNPPPGYLCHPKRGWLPPNTDELVRDHLYKYVQEALKSSYNAELKIEQASSDDENYEDDASTSAAAEAEEAENSEKNNIVPNISNKKK
ncbi:general transcription factor 3C polypeptide 5 [Amyelois transitella]|uniref:general transcription factor 3C polypeptide 5 n=1 Tax=Amyelois transitella TaxID=680683 RepID=UPI00298FA8B6|nr:general transcription factor 3C polypeptide 5 [Amyelois transitella]